MGGRRQDPKTGARLETIPTHNLQPDPVTSSCKKVITPNDEGIAFFFFFTIHCTMSQVGQKQQTVTDRCHLVAVLNTLLLTSEAVIRVNEIAMATKTFQVKSNRFNFCASQP